MDFLQATILVLVVTNQRILLAADSRKTYLNGTAIQKTGLIDKIYSTNDCYYAVCGFHEEEWKFSIHRQIHDCLVKFTTLHEAVTQILKTLARSLKNYFNDLRNTTPEIFSQMKKYSSLRGEIFLVQRIKNIPTAYLLEYHILESKSIQVAINSWIIKTSDIKETQKCFWRAIGNTGYLPSSISEETWASQPEMCAKKVIEEGIIKYPVFVSAPVNILEITGKGVQWVEKSPTSPNYVKY